MKIASVADVKARFSGFLKSCKDGPVVVTNGRPVAVLVAEGEEDELERLVLAHTPRFRRLLEEAEERIESAGGIRHEEFWASLRGRSKRTAKARYRVRPPL